MRNGCVIGHWRQEDLDALTRSARRTAWPWDKTKIRRVAARLEMSTDRVVRQLRKMRLGDKMRCSPCGYCCHFLPQRVSGFCRRGSRNGWKKCGETDAMRDRRAANDHTEAGGRKMNPHRCSSCSHAIIPRKPGRKGMPILICGASGDRWWDAVREWHDCCDKWDGKRKALEGGK